MTELIDAIRAAIDEDERRATPQTVIHSGGYPAPVVPNCVGPTGDGCVDRWSIDPAQVPMEEWPALEREHSFTHITPAQRRTLRQVATHRKILDWLDRLNEYRIESNCWGMPSITDVEEWLAEAYGIEVEG